MEIIGASLSEPHIDETNARNPYIMFIIIGASLSEPHINGTAMREFYIIIIIIMVRPSREIIYIQWSLRT